MSKRENSTRTKYINTITIKNNAYENVIGKMVFSFKFFLAEEPGQSFEEWEQKKLLADLNVKLKGYSSMTRQDLKQGGILVEYGNFPVDSEFTEPKVFNNMDITWARFRLTSGVRLVGVFMSGKVSDLKDVFYIVFLDKDHKFYPCEER